MLIPYIQAILLGLLQGATEFLPVSSSAHLIILPWLFGWTNPVLTSLTFDVALHLGTLLAVLIYFAADFLRLIRAAIDSIRERCIGPDPDRRLAWFIVAGTIPGGIFGFFFESKVDALFHTPGEAINPLAMVAVALFLATVGALLLLADRYASHPTDLKDISFKQAIWIGCAQALAIFPGISRSGSTITTGLALGLKREAAARFSFLLGAPIIAGIGLKSLLEIYSGIHAGTIAPGDWALFPIGVVTAAVAGLLCIRFLLRYLQKHPMNLFVYYRFALAALVAIVALAR
jgi:undecaprenyl-diphosphatase